MQDRSEGKMQEEKNQMENFEYSIQLNDRDWAEFYVASEECSLIQAALATAEEPFPSDLEDGDVENRLIRIRVGPGPTPSPASCLPQGALHRHLLAEEVLSGSEDEADFGSVSRFLCGGSSSQRSPAFPQPAAVQGSQPSHVASEPLGGQHELPELAREREALCAAEGRESETGDRFAGSDRSLPKVDAAVQNAEFPGQISGPEAMEKPVCSVPMDSGASKGTGGQASPPGLALQQPTNDTSSTASVDIQFPLPLGSKAVCGNPESPELKGLNAHPSSSTFPSRESEGGKQPESGTENLQAEAPLFPEKPSLFQGPSVPPFGTLAPSDPPSESHREGVVESKSNEEEKATDLTAEGQADQSEDLVDSILKEDGQAGQEMHSPGCRVNLPKVPEEPEASKCPWLPIVMDPRCSGTLDRHREMAGVKAESHKDGAEEPCCHLRPAVALEDELPRMAQGSQRANFLEDNIPYCLPSVDSLEGHLAVMTRPRDDNCFIGGDTQEQAETMQDVVAEKRLASDVGQDLPEMYGPEMYEYFFIDTEGAQVGESGGEKDLEPETLSSSDQLLAPSSGSQDLDSITGGEATYISVPEVYEHFFNNGAQGRRSWKRLLLSMPASEAKKALRALKSLLSKPAHLLRGHPSSPGTPLRRGSHGELVVFSPRLLEESQPRPEDLRMAVMSPVLLANFGTLSAIRYFRRQIVAGGEHGT